MNAIRQRINSAATALKRAGHKASHTNTGDHFEAQAGSTKDTYLTNELEVANFFEAEAAQRGISLKKGGKEIENPTPKKAAGSAANRKRSKKTNRNTQMKKPAKQIQDAVGTMPKAATIAGGAATSLFITKALITNFLADQSAALRQFVRVAVPLTVGQVLRRVNYGDRELRTGLATGAEVDATVAGIQILANYVPQLGFVADRLAVAPGDASETLEGPFAALPAFEYPDEVAPSEDERPRARITHLSEVG